MGSKFLLTVSCLLVLVSLSQSADPDYYWRPYKGKIPTDALPASYNFENFQYVGRGPVLNTGIFAGLLLPGSDSITVATADSTYTIYEHLEILCEGSVSSWNSANVTSFESMSDIVEQTGYYFNGYTKLYLGRLDVDLEDSFYTAYTVIGNVNQGDSLLYYNSKGDVVTSSDYQVRTFGPP